MSIPLLPVKIICLLHRRDQRVNTILENGKTWRGKLAREIALQSPLTGHRVFRNVITSSQRPPIC